MEDRRGKNEKAENENSEENVKKLLEEVERLRELVEICKKYVFFSDCKKEGCISVQISDGLLIPTCMNCKFIQKCCKCEETYCNLHLTEKGIFFRNFYCDNCVNNNKVSYF